jgi:DNA ligase (NAD+)
MNIDKFGEKLVEELYDNKLISSFSDIYKLHEEALSQLPRKKEKSIRNILSSIEKSKTTTLAKFIYALGIRFVGETTSEILVNHFKSIDHFLSASHEELCDLHEIGPKVAESIISWIQLDSNKEEVKKLISLGIRFKDSEEEGTLSGTRLSGKTFLITGTLPLPRAEAESIIKKNGGQILSGVSRNLSALVVGANPGSKLKKAEQLGIPVKSWDDLINEIKN